MIFAPDYARTPGITTGTQSIFYMNPNGPLLSIVIPMYNESAGMETLFARLTAVLSALTPDWEIICVNDGSNDNTLALLKTWHKREPRVRILSLSRNFGKEAALT